MSLISLMDNIAGDIPLEKDDSWRARWHTLRNALIDIEAHQTKEALQNMVHFNCVRCGKQLHIAENIFIFECSACKTQYKFNDPSRPTKYAPDFANAPRLSRLCSSCHQFHEQSWCPNPQSG